MTSALIRLMRPHQWIKNGFLFVGVVFGHGWSDSRLVAEALVLFAAFCLASSAVYILNDIADRDADRLHPHKRERPLARGEIGVGAPIALCIALALAGLALAAAVSLAALLIAAAYLVLNIGYSAGLKHVAILDVFMIAGGFMLRILAGTAGIGIPPSNWLLLCGLMLTLFLGICTSCIRRGAGAIPPGRCCAVRTSSRQPRAGWARPHGSLPGETRPGICDRYGLWA